MSDTNRKTPKCSFCGKDRRQVHTMVAGTDVYICDECIELCVDVVDEEHDRRKSTLIDGALSELPTPLEIYNQLEEYVIGQEQAKKYLSVAVYNHYKRAKINSKNKHRDRRHSPSKDDDTFDIEKSNILLIGPTGCGKTLLAKTLAKILDVPFAIADATSLTEAGYVGEDVENILLYLIQDANDDIAMAQRGIVYIDEIDKIARKSDGASTSRDVSGEGVQQALLKLIEGTVAHVPPKGGRKHPQAEYTKIDTSDILFICGGAFGGIEDVVMERLKAKRCGFGFVNAQNNTDIDVRDIDKSKIYNLVEPRDLIRYGLISEFVGRIPVISPLDPLTEESLLQILTEPKGCITQQYKKLFEADGIKLSFTDGALRAIAAEAIKRETGARGLRAIFEDVMMETMFQAPSDKDKISEVIINEQSVVEKTKPIVIMASHEELETPNEAS